MDSRTGPNRESQGKEVRAHCAECQRETTHTVTASAEYESQYSDRGFSMTSWDDYQVIECKGCQTLSFRHVNRNTENTDHDSETEEEFLVETVKRYPELDSGRSELRHSELLPNPIQQIYQETLSALNGGMRVLSGIGLRAMVETMCKDRKAAGRNLEDRIDGLVAQGVVARDGAEILHGLRIMGNLAARAQGPARAAPSNSALWNDRLCGRGLESLQLMRRLVRGQHGQL